MIRKARNIFATVWCATPMMAIVIAIAGLRGTVAAGLAVVVAHAGGWLQTPICRTSSTKAMLRMGGRHTNAQWRRTP